jgi:hypothetical protein
MLRIAVAPAVFYFVSRERITADGIALRSAGMMRRRLRIGEWQVCAASRIAPKRRQVRCGYNQGYS